MLSFKHDPSYEEELPEEEPIKEAEEPPYTYDDYGEAEEEKEEEPLYGPEDYSKNKEEEPRPDKIPRVLKNRIEFFEEWAQSNKKDAYWDRIYFWSLKLPAIVISVSSGIFAYLNMQLLTMLGGTIASLCVLIDGLRHPGMLYNTHAQAVHDLREVQMEIRSSWQIGSLEDRDRKELTVEILKHSSKERKRIKEYLLKAETKLGKKVEQ